MPLNDIALGHIPQAEMHNASGLYNLTRNLGGAIGLAFINSLLINYSRTMSFSLNESISLTSEYARQYIEFTSGFFADKISDSQNLPYYIIHGIIEKEAYVVAMNNIYMLLAWLFLAATLIVPFSSKIDNNTNVSAGH